MSTPTLTPRILEPFRSAKRQLHAIVIVAVLAIGCFVLWPRLSERLLATDFLPHLYCYLRNPALVWTHVAADSLIAIAYFAISITLGYLVYKGWRNLPFQGLLTAFGLFILACGCTHVMEVVTVWVPVYVVSGAVKILTALASVTTAPCFRSRFHKPWRSYNRQRHRNGSLPSYAPVRNEKTPCCVKSITG